MASHGTDSMGQPIQTVQSQMESIGTDSGAAQSKDEKTYYVVVMQLNAEYAKSMQGILKLCQVAFLLVGLIFLTTAEPRYAGYLLLPLDWHLRVFVFVTVFCLLVCLASYIVHLYSLTDSLRIDWNKFDFILYCLLGFSLLFASSMVASAITYYDQLLPDTVPRNTKKHLVIGTIFGYVSMVLCGASAYYAGRQWHALVQQFRPRQFTSRGSTMSQPQTPTEGANSTVNIVV